MSSDVPNRPHDPTDRRPVPSAGAEANVETHVIPVVQQTVQVGPLDQPRTPSAAGATAADGTRVLPAVEPAAAPRTGAVPDGPATSAVAWDDDATRARAGARLRPTLIAAIVGAVALIAAVVAAVLGVLQLSWGMWVLVVLAGIAGGCLAGALAGWSIEAPMRALLRSHPWERLDGLVGLGGQIVVIAEGKRRAFDLDADRDEPLGEVGGALSVRACGGRDEKVVEFGPRRRWRLAERVAVMLPDQRDLDEVDDEDDWRPSGPLGEQPDEDGLYAG